MLGPARFTNFRQMLVTHGSWELEDTEYIAKEKPFHELWKKSGMAECNTMPAPDFWEVSHYVYAHELVGRAGWSAKKTVLEEILMRQTSSKDRVAR
eukprot:5584727-Amphidinium_carterae.1